MAVSSGATLDLHGYSINVGALSGAGTINNLSGSSTYTLTFGNASGTFSGVIKNTTGTIALTEAGAGTLTLAGSNSYTGGTTLSGGQFNINNASALGTGSFTISGGSIGNTSGGTIVLSTTGAENWNGNFAFVGPNDLSLGTGAVALNNNPVVTVTQNNLIVGGVISGSDFLIKSGPGALTLAGSNTYSYGTTLYAGQLNINNAHALGNGGLTINGGTIANTSAGAITISTATAESWNADFAFTGTNSLNLGFGNVTLYNNRTVTASSGTLVVGGVIADGGHNYSLTESGGSGVLVLSGADTYGGGTTLSAGQLNINNPSALGTGTFTISGGTIGNAYGSAITLSANNAQTWNGNFTFAGPNDLNLGTGTVSMNAACTVTVASNNLTVGGAISGSGSLTEAGAGTLILDGSNTYTGSTTIAGGTLQLGDGTSSNGSVSSGTITDNSMLTIADPTAETATYDITGSGSLTKVGPGTLILVATSTYTGGTTVGGGTLQVGSSAALGSTSGAATISSGLLDLHGYNVSTGALSGAGTIDNLSGSGTYTLTVGNDNANSTFSGTIQNTTGTVALAKAGAGVLTLEGGNAYTGTTSITAGTLQLAAVVTPVIHLRASGTVGAAVSTATGAIPNIGSLGSSENGTIGGAGPTYVAAPFAQGINLAGQYLSSPANASFDSLQTWTDSFWINASSSANFGSGVLVSTRDADSDPAFVECYDGSHIYLRDVASVGGSWLPPTEDPTNPSSWRDTVTLSTSAWHMITVTVSSAGWAIYVDGAPGASGSTGGIPQMVANGYTGGLWIGNRPGYSGMTGVSFDDFQLYGSVLTAAQINSIYLNGAVAYGTLPTASPVQIAGGADPRPGRHQPNGRRVVRPERRRGHRDQQQQQYSGDAHPGARRGVGDLQRRHPGRRRPDVFDSQRLRHAGPRRQQHLQRNDHDHRRHVADRGRRHDRLDQRHRRHRQQRLPGLQSHGHGDGPGARSPAPAA